MPFCRFLALLPVLFLASISAAQTYTFIPIIPPVTYAVVGAPFTVEYETIATEIRPDGGEAQFHVYGRIYHDSAGRQRYEQTSENPKFSSITIFDVVAERTIKLDPSSSTAKVILLNPKVKVPASRPIAWRKEIPRPAETEALGTQEIAGLQAEGTRRIYISMVGPEGDKHEIRIVDELWTSPLYRMPLLHIYDDPSRGKSVSRVTMFAAGEPDPQLFRIPRGYKITVESARPRRH
jgi:hypothetical protein